MKGRKKIAGTTEKLIRLANRDIKKLQIKAVKAEKPVKIYIEEVLSNHAKS